MEQQLAQILQGLITQNTHLAQQLEQNNAMMAQMQQTQAEQTAVLQEVTRRGRDSGVVDVGKIGKPDALRGANMSEIKKQWPDWSFTFRTWFTSQFRHGEDILKWASERYVISP